MWTNFFFLILLVKAWGFTRGNNKDLDVKQGDNELYFLNDPPVEGSTYFTDLDDSSGLGTDDEDTPGSGFGPDDDDDDDDGTDGSGGLLTSVDNPRADHHPPKTTTTTTTTTTPTHKTPRILEKPAGNPPPYEEDNKVPEFLDPVTPEASKNPISVHSTTTQASDHNSQSSDIRIEEQKQEERQMSFFGQPGILAAVIGGAVVGLLCAILLVMFIVYRMRKKDEGSYALDEPKRSPTVNSYTRSSNKEFYA